MTANLLSRKGDALPSSMAKTVLDWNSTIPSFDSPPPPSPAAPRAANGHHRAVHADQKQAGPADHTLHTEDHPHPRKIQIGLSDEDHERLRIVAARREISRQAAVREALSEYFERLGQDYKNECRCISGTSCARPCVS